MKIGKIISVEYDKFRVRLFNTTKNSTVNIDGQVYYFGNIGSYLKTVNSSGEYIFCEVTAIVDWIGKDNQNYSTFNLDSSREIIIKPIGTLSNDKFQLGVGVFPSLYSDVEIVTYDDLDNVLSTNNNEVIEGIHKSIEIGISKNLINYRITLDIDRLFNIHTAVLGNSGSGKSNTIAHILQNIYRKDNNYANGAKTIIFDANGEYPISFGKTANLNSKINPFFYKPNINSETEISTGTESIKLKPFYLPYCLMNLDEWLSFLMASDRTQKPFWDKVLQECYKFYKIFNEEEGKNFVNYIKWKVRQMLFSVLTRVDSDTSKMTAAKGIIAKISEICGCIPESQDGEYITDLKNFIYICNELCFVNYGDNKDTLSNALSLFVVNGTNQKYVSLKTNKTEKRVELIDSFQENEFLQIDEHLAFQIAEQKLKSGEYFDYKYLRAAVEIVLIEEESRGILHIRDFVSTLLSRLDFFMLNPECEFMRINANKYQNVQDYLSQVLGISDEAGITSQLITIDLSEVGTDILELMTTVISRMIFDFRKKKLGEERRQKPIHLILDEAHRYIKKDAEYIMRENIFEKIAREGRKYSLYLIVSSQRPSELSQTVLSQCGNYIVHRIQNEVDMKYVYSVLPYYSDDYTNKIKQAVPGEALIFGNCVPMPLMVKIFQANPAPDSKNCIVSEEWYKTVKTN